MTELRGGHRSRKPIRAGRLAARSLAALCLIAVAASAAPEHRRLNNFVTELLHVEGELAAAGNTFTFENPRDGWVFFNSTAHVEGRQGLLVALKSQTSPVLRHRPGRPDTVEAMRYLPKGEHALLVRAVQGAALKSLTVRAIAEIIFDVYGVNPHLSGYGPYDVGFLKRAGVVDTCNVFITSPAAADDFLLEWTAVHGKHVLGSVSAVRQIGGKDVTAETALRFWAGQDDAFAASSGIIVDDFRMDASMDKHGAAWRGALKRFSRERPDRLLYVYIGTEYPYPGTNGKRLEPFVGELLSTPARFAYEFYLFERETEAEARADVARRFLENMRGFHTYAPEFQKRLIFTLGFLCGTPEMLNRNPAVNYKTHLDIQFHEIATNPLLDGARGVELYRSTYCDDEYLRWGVKLCRHYCIEGKTERLSSDPYQLDHITNPDFVEGLEGWTVSMAAPESMGRRVLKGHGRCQGRFPPLTGPDVDSFLWTKRQANGPNKVSQTLRDLVPGRAYSVKLFVGDYGEMTDMEKLRSAKPRKHAVHVTLDGAALIEDESINDAIRSYYGLDDERKNKLCFNFLRIVFRPKAETARLEISDWASATEPGGPIGQELTFSFVEVEPFFMPDE